MDSSPDHDSPPGREQVLWDRTLLTWPGLGPRTERRTLVRSHLAALSLVLASGAFPASAVPPAAGGALASDGVELVASFPDVPAIGGRFVGDTLYVTTSQGLRIYDTGTLDGIPVLMGALELPHFENEDVDTDGNILLISADQGGLENLLYVIDVSLPQAPLVAGILPFGPEGHTVSCIFVEGRCDYAWIAGGGRLPIIDLRDPSSPRAVGSLSLPEGARGSHDVQVDAAGIAWVSAGGGLFGYDASDPLNPTLVAANFSDGDHQGPELNSNFIIHNSLRPNADQMDPDLLADSAVDPGELLLVTEEDYLSACMDEGSFQTARMRTNATGDLVVERLDSFILGGGTVTDGRKPVGASCSAHYFDIREDGVVALAYYEQGTRFLDVSDPTDIRQIGYYLPVVTETWATRWHDGLLYTFDVARGLEVLRFTGGPASDEVQAPRLNPPTGLTKSSSTWGWVCRQPVTSV